MVVGFSSDLALKHLNRFFLIFKHVLFNFGHKAVLLSNFFKPFLLLVSYRLDFLLFELNFLHLDLLILFKMRSDFLKINFCLLASFFENNFLIFLALLLFFSRLHFKFFVNIVLWQAFRHRLSFLFGVALNLCKKFIGYKPLS